MSLPPGRTRYRLYIDESGDHACKLLDDSSHRYLALLGVWFRQPDHYTSFADSLELFKRRIFGPRPDKPVTLHRSDIINRKGPFGLLCQPEIRDRFNSGLLQIVADATFRMVCVVFDKRNIQSANVAGFHPYHYCLDLLMDRYVEWLRLHNAVGDVMAETRGREENRKLEEEYSRGYEGLKKHRFPEVLTSKDIKIQPKVANIAGLQLADVLAHPVKQAILMERGLIPNPGDTFGMRLYAIAQTKFNCGELVGTDGYGKVFL